MLQPNVTVSWEKESKWKERRITEALATKVLRAGDEGLREVRKGLKRGLGELGKEREEKEEEGNLGEKRMLGLEEMREAEGAREAMGE